MDGWVGKGARAGKRILARFVSQATPFGLILTAREDVADQTVSAEEAARLRRVRERVVLVAGRGAPSGSFEGGLDQGPAASDPVTVATIDELVGTTREAAFGGVLSRGQPRDK
jgi:hypothetical protein